MHALTELEHIIPALAFKPLEQFLGSANASGERRVGHCPDNFDVPAFVGEEEDFAFDFDARDIFAKIDRPTHTPISRAAGTERTQDATVMPNGKIDCLTGRQP